MGFDKFIDKNKREDKIIEKFNGASKNATKKQKRILEEKLLKPQKIPKYLGDKMVSKGLEERSVKFIFNSLKDLERFKEFFITNTSNGNNTRDIDIIMNLIELFEDNILRYNREEKVIEINVSGNENEGIWEPV